MSRCCSNSTLAAKAALLSLSLMAGSAAHSATQDDQGWLLPYTLKLTPDGATLAQPGGRDTRPALNLVPDRNVLGQAAPAASELVWRGWSGQTTLADAPRLILSGSNCQPLPGERAASCAGSTLLDAYSVGASWAPSKAFSVSLDYFSRPVLIDGGRVAPTIAAKSFTAPAATVPTWQPHLATAEGLDVNLAVGVPGGALGEFAVGLQLAKILPETDRAALIREPLTRAVMDLGWSAGQFRGSLVSRYLSEQVSAEGDSWTSLDLNLAWRTPWSGSFSVGARNLLDNQAPLVGGLVGDGFESGLGDSLGRVPYVRYQQDL